jgi:hypothetical protein
MDTNEDEFIVVGVPQFHHLCLFVFISGYSYAVLAPAASAAHK